ncbi:NADase-type glycan-binding domain-containing protein [Nocardioides rubriscoriae]|uniref:NADase-type glycan-binding domain-containing protein n=1 Tax=Nocardioides rubriscoriae TaxID=642762 RepID=UPI0011DFE51D|nr:hypothetical protein [Nocardioides rubriscoriae]
MDLCARCGHALGVGRYCVNCGHPRDAGTDAATDAATAGDDWRTATAERPAVPSADPAGSSWAPAAPPPVFETPPQARYPMYADDPTGPPGPVAPAATPAAWDTPTTVGAGGAPHSHAHTHAHGRRSALPWVVGAAVLLLLVGLGGFLLLGGGSGDNGDGEASDVGQQAPATGSASPTAPSTAPSTSTPTDPTSSPTAVFPDDATDVASAATAVAPDTAEPGVDVNGNAVRYDAYNMLDRQDDTAWRSPGDESGSTLTFTLDQPTRLAEVGLLNGYAKTDPGYDGYTANRRVLAVEWVFDDGTVVPQSLTQSRSVQSIDVDVVTSAVQLRILSVSRPAPGPRGRDFTAISTVRLLGVPAS